jgi:nitrogen regulatory protein P-II 1
MAPSTGPPSRRPLNDSNTRLLVVVINDPDRLDEILTGFLDLGITGATVINSEGMGRILPEDIPIFAGLRAVVGDERPRNTTIFSVVPSELVQPALDVVKGICGDLAAPSTGIAFVLPVEHVTGLAPGLERTSESGEAGVGGSG